MRKLNNTYKPSPSRMIACTAVMCALLIGGQLALSWVSGVEVVSVILLSFSFVFGVRYGMLAALSFSLLRCFIWGFYPSVIVLYCLYYPLFALAFGALGKIKNERYAAFPLWAVALVNLLLAALCAACVYAAVTDFLKISVLAKTMVKSLLWAIAALSAALAATFDAAFIACKFKKNGATLLKLVLVCAVAAAFTVCFTLADDVITPIFMGWGLFSVSSATYFYSSFLALAPHTLCVIVTVACMFLPLSALLERIKRRVFKGASRRGAGENALNQDSADSILIKNKEE